MRRIKRINIWMLSLVCIVVFGGCGRKMNQEEYIIEKIESEKKDINNMAEGEKNEMKTLVTTEEFRKFYSMEEGRVSEEYLKTFIERRELTLLELTKRNYDVMVKKLYDSDIVYEASIYKLISGEKISNIEEIELSELTHMIMWNDKIFKGTDVCTAEYIVLDIEKQKLYFSYKDITSNYESAENIADIEDVWIQERFSEVKKVLSKNTTKLTDGETMKWHLYFVQKDGKVAMFSGTMNISGTDNEMHEWYQKVILMSGIQ